VGLRKCEASQTAAVEFFQYLSPLGAGAALMLLIPAGVFNFHGRSLSPRRCSHQMHLAYRLRLTVTGNYSLRELVEQERMHPAIVRRLDDMCRVIQL